MLLKYLLVGVIFYFIVKTSGNLVRAIRGELDTSQHDPRFDHRTRSSGSRSSTTWETDDRKRSSSRHSQRWEEDIEDAQWEDL